MTLKQNELLRQKEAELEAALDAVGLDHDVSLLGGHFCRVCRVWLGVNGGITRADRKSHEKSKVGEKF